MLYVEKILHYYDFDIKQRKQVQHQFAWDLLQEVLKKDYNIDLSAQKILYETNGKPYIENSNIYFSISHCNDMVAIFVSNNRNGVDIEQIREIKDAVIKRVCSINEYSYITRSKDINKNFIKLWTLKESFAKADGRGLGLGLNNITFDLTYNKIISNQQATFNLHEFGNFIAATCEICK